MEKKEFDFLQDHSRNYLEMALSADRHEVPEHPDGYGKRVGDCGDTVEMFLIFNKDRLKHVSFRVNGCMNTNACANTVAHLTEGKTLQEAWDITPEKVIGFLESLPPENHHCAELAVGAYYLALADFQRFRRGAPYRWRKQSI